MGQDWPIQGAVDEYRCDLASLGPAHPSEQPSRHRQKGRHLVCAASAAFTRARLTRRRQHRDDRWESASRFDRSLTTGVLGCLPRLLGSSGTHRLGPRRRVVASGAASGEARVRSSA